MNREAQVTDILRVQRIAEDDDSEAFSFLAMFPSGPRNCKFLDAYMGLVKIDGIDGFVTVDQLERQFPGLQCIVPAREEA